MKFMISYVFELVLQWPSIEHGHSGFKVHSESSFYFQINHIGILQLDTPRSRPTNILSYQHTGRPWREERPLEKTRFLNKD